MLVADFDSLNAKYKALGGKIPQELINSAEKYALMPVNPVSNKKHYDFGATPNDYVSLGTYWWENPDTENGLPFIRRDGYINPLGLDTTRYDRRRIDEMTQAVFVLTNAWFYTRDMRWKKAACEHLDAWFINEKTRMNPALTYAQQIPGICNGRDIGIIDTHSFIDLIDSAIILDYEHIDALKSWFSEYLNWLKTSENGKGEAQKLNNHGLWYDTQVMAFGAFVGDVNTVKQTAESIENRLTYQVAPDGSLPEELERTRSFMYSLFALRAVFYAHTIAKNNGCGFLDEKWKKCFDFILPYVSGEKKWEHQQIDEVAPFNKAICMRFAAEIYNDSKFLSAADKLYKEKDSLTYTYRFPIK